MAERLSRRKLNPRYPLGTWDDDTPEQLRHHLEAARAEGLGFIEAWVRAVPLLRYRSQRAEYEWFLVLKDPEHFCCWKEAFERSDRRGPDEALGKLALVWDEVRDLHESRSSVVVVDSRNRGVNEGHLWRENMERGGGHAEADPLEIPDELAEVGV